jgi:hypothetical protein
VIETRDKDEPWDIDDIRLDVQLAFEISWESEIESRMEPEYVDECISANEYEFTVSGRPY